MDSRQHFKDGEIMINLISFFVEKYVKINELFRLLIFIAISTFIFLFVFSLNSILTILFTIILSMIFLYVDGYITYSYYMVALEDSL